MLRILTGRAGSGKTAWTLARMKEEGTRRPQLLVVPEQASFEMEVRLCRDNGNQAGAYGEVLSFTRLANRVLTRTGGAARPVLDEGGRLLTMYDALRGVQANLTVYALPARKPEFLASLLTTMDELKSCCVTGGQLLQVGEETEGLDGEKLRDLGLIFGAYEALTARGAMDPRDRLTRLAEGLQQTPFFRDRDVYLDGFTDFTPQQGLVLEQMLRQAPTVTVSLTWDAAEDEGIFAPAEQTIARLKRLAARVGCPVTEVTCVSDHPQRTPPLAHVEQALFRPPLAPYQGPWDDSVVVRVLPSPREEVAWAAGEIRELVRRGEVRCRDIVIAARNIDPYWEQLEGIFAQYELPLFQADKTDILQKPLFTLVTAALDTVTGGYLYEDVFRYLKTGLAGLTPEECDRLENYVLTWDLWGSRWTASQGWTLHPGGYHQQFTPEDEAELADLNALRLRVITPLEHLRKQAGGTLGQQVLALYRFLEEIQAPEALEARSALLLDRGEPELARQVSQLWEIFCGALEQCYGMLGEREAELGEFSRLLRLLLSRYSVGTIPASLDRVTAGDAQRLGGRACKVLFLLGADESAIPQVTPGQGLLTDRDRELLEDYGLTLSPRLEEKISRENTIVYTTCAQPTQRLYVSWAAQGEGGGEKRPSFLVQRLETLFPQAGGTGSAAPSPDRLRAMAARLPEVRAALSEDAACRRVFQQLERGRQWRRGHLSPGAVRALYGEKVAMSASRVDQYRSCHFAYFLRYGLGARERRTAGFHAPEYGTFIHFVLEFVLRAAKEEGGVPQLSDQRLEELTTQAITAYVAQELGGMAQQTPRFQYLFRRLEQNVRAVVQNVTEELRSSDFQPILFELGFGPGQALPPVELKEAGVTLRLSGFVDRVDGWVQDGRLYLRVVDYKTGRKSFDLTEVWHGLGLQMLLYLFTLEERGETLFGQPPIPAGVLYLPARDAMIAGSRTMDEATRRKLLDKELVRRGLVLDDEAVLQAMEHSEGGLRFLPLRVSARTGKITGDALVNAQKLGRLKKHIQQVLGEICQEIARGNIDADPFWRGPEKNACQFCPFFRACQFEADQDRRHWVPSVKNKDFWDWLAQKEEGEEDHGGQTDA